MAESDAFYNDIAATVDEVLDEFGTSYNVYAPGPYNEDTLSSSHSLSRSVVGVVADRETTLLTANPGGAAAGDPVAAAWVGEKNLLMKASASPQTDELVEVDGKKHSMQKAVPIKPADIVVLYILDVTR